MGDQQSLQQQIIRGSSTKSAPCVWRTRSMPGSLEREFVQYMSLGKAPMWVRHYSRSIGIGSLKKANYH